MEVCKIQVNRINNVLTSSTVLSLSSAAVLNLLRLKAHFENFVSVRGPPPLKIVPLANNDTSKALLCHHITLYKIIVVYIGISLFHASIWLLYIVGEIKKLRVAKFVSVSNDFS